MLEANERAAARAAFAAWTLVAAAAAMALGVPTAAPAASTVERVAASSSEPVAEDLCRVGARTTVTDTARACERRVLLEAAPWCADCPGGLNVVFIQINKTFQVDWMIQESLSALRELERYNATTVQVGVVSYDRRGAKVELGLTDRMSAVRSALRKPRYGHDPYGDFVAAAHEAHGMLAAQRAPIGRPPCELVIFFASTKSTDRRVAADMLEAARWITDDGIPLIAACDTIVPAFCVTTKEMPVPRAYYAEAEDHRLPAHVRLEIARHGAPPPAVDAWLRHELPPGLEIEDGSLDPAPSEVRAAAGLTTTLTWHWPGVDPGAVLTATYRVRVDATDIPMAGTIRGSMEITHPGSEIVSWPLAPAAITIDGPCETPSPPPPPATATATREPTGTPAATGEPQPTATPTDVGTLVYLPYGKIGK